jgi:hypothetical protein
MVVYSSLCFQVVVTQGGSSFQEELFSCFPLLAGSFSPIIIQELKLPSSGRGFPAGKWVTSSIRGIPNVDLKKCEE